MWYNITILYSGVFVFIKYQQYDFTIQFSETTYSDVYPAFLLRSVLGKELKSFSCVLRRRKCEECPLKFQCAYSYIFESPISKDNEFLKGRDKVSHPFTIFCREDAGKKLDSLSFSLTLFGRGIDYFPYIFYAFKKGGESGLFRRKTKYDIVSIFADGKMVNDGESEELEIPDSKNWELSTETNEIYKKIKLNVDSPLRLKVNGNYTDKITYRDFLYSAARRAEILSAKYGINNADTQLIKNLSEKSEDICLYWKDYDRYSARQKQKMKLGGCLGTMDIEGNFNSHELSLLNFCEIFGLGKNTGFGFGKISVEDLDG